MKKITVIDLNNFSYYPTLAIGYLIAALRKAEFDVKLLSPLNHGVAAPKRERIENIIHYWKSLLLNSDKVMVKIDDVRTQGSILLQLVPVEK